MALSANRFIGTWKNCVEAPPCRKRISCSVPSCISSRAVLIASSSTAWNRGVRCPISRIDRPVPLKSRMERLASSNTSFGRTLGPELKLWTTTIYLYVLKKEAKDKYFTQPALPHQQHPPK